MKSDDKIKSKIFKLVKEYYVEHFRNRSISTNKINYSGRVFDENELINLIDSSLEFWLTSGRYTEMFEKELARYIGSRYCLFVNSGSSANLLAFMALTSDRLGERRIKRGDEVITVAACFPTTVSPILIYGAKPVFVDIDIPTYNIKIDYLEKAVTKKTKAVFLAHTLGNPFNIEVIKDLCDKYGLWLIEDNCDALGTLYKYKGKWVKTGSVGDIGTSSFYPPHHITTGEGGAVYTNNRELYKILLSMRDWGRDCFCPSGKDNSCGKRFSQKLGLLPYGYDHKYIYSHFGFNLKATDMQAAIGIAQLKKLPRFVEARRKNWATFCKRLKKFEDFIILPKAEENSKPSWFGFLISVKKNKYFKRDDLVSFLENNGIQTRMLFAGNIIKHPCFDTLRKSKKHYKVFGTLENTDFVMNNSFWIGVYPKIGPSEIDYITNKIEEFINNKVR